MQAMYVQPRISPTSVTRQVLQPSFQLLQPSGTAPSADVDDDAAAAEWFPRACSNESTSDGGGRYGGAAAVSDIVVSTATCSGQY